MAGNGGNNDATVLIIFNVYSTAKRVFVYPATSLYSESPVLSRQQNANGTQGVLSALVLGIF